MREGVPGGAVGSLLTQEWEPVCACTCREVAKPGTGTMPAVVTRTDTLASWGKQFASSEEAIDFRCFLFQHRMAKTNINGKPLSQET